MLLLLLLLLVVTGGRLTGPRGGSSVLKRGYSRLRTVAGSQEGSGMTGGQLPSGTALGARAGSSGWREGFRSP